MATNRLRKRLDEADEQTKARVNESFCIVGTPLPSLDSKRDANEYKPEWQQEVYDEQGRRRFHGAFTGGFSAGYYNTVGSKEGWTPSSFRSSRKEKEKAKQKNGDGNAVERRRVEDFMDDEDVADLRQGRGALRSSDAYGGGKPRAAQSERDPLLGMLGLSEQSGSGTANFSSLEIKSGTSATIGIKILQLMGWKPGHGLGPRVTAKRRRELDAVLGLKSYTIDDFAIDDRSMEGLIAPPDTQLVRPIRSQATRGLGWEGPDRPATLTEALQRDREQGSKPTEVRRGGFGIGALEQDSDEEEEVYAVGHQIEHSTLAQGRRRAAKGNNVSHGKTTGQSQESQSDNKENTWHDGRPMLAGFTIAQQPPALERWYASPHVPPDWKPDPQRVWSQDAAKTTIKGEVSATNLKINLGPDQRASILGEARIPGPPPMITDYLSAKARERIERAKVADSKVADLAVGSTVIQGQASSATESAHLSVPHLDEATARAALLGFMPFGNESAKQRRYQHYLTSQAEPHRSIILQPDVDQSDEQFYRELNEFSRSAAIFRPMSTVMASRFESSSSGSTHMQAMEPGLYLPESNAKRTQAEQVTRSSAEQKRHDDERARNEWQGMTSPRRNARMGLFGPDTTREVKVWKPARLLCKRFNVPAPYNQQEDEPETGEGSSGVHDAKPTGEEFDDFGESTGRRQRGGGTSNDVNARWNASKQQLQHLAATRAWETPSSSVRDEGVRQTDEERLVARPNKEQPDTKSSHLSDAAYDLANVGLGSEDRAREEMSYVKPPLDLFKAIFVDDDGGEEKTNGHIPQARDEVEGRSGTSRHASPPSSHESVIPSPYPPLPRPTFVPRKRHVADVAVRDDKKGSATSDASSKHAAKKARRDGGRGSDKAKGRSLLTFAIDDGDDDGSPGKSDVGDMHRQRDVTAGPYKTSRRPRASDLFD